MNANQIQDHIIEASKDVQTLVDAEFAKCGGAPARGSALDQAGLRDGNQIVLDYLAHNEAGVALEHVVYMVRETGVVLSIATRDRIRAAATALHIDAGFDL